MKSSTRIAAFAASLIIAAASVLAQEKKTDAPHGGGAGQPSAEEMAKMMETFTKLAAPGPHHQHLAALAGNWTIAGKFRMTPDQPWEEHKSESEAEMMLGGRFLFQHFEGEPMLGMPTNFEGLGFMGFDNQKGKLVSVWMDNMGTMIMTSEGACDAGCKSMTFRGDFVDPMTNQPTYMKSVYKIESPTKYVLLMYAPDADGKEFQMMELVHTKKQS